MSLEFETVNGMSTFFAYGWVSDEAIQQCIDVYNILNPYPGSITEGVDKDKKDSYDVCIPPNHSLLLQEELCEMGAAYAEYFHFELWVPPLTIVEAMNIQKYPLSGGFHKLHTERGYTDNTKVRELVWMVYLNDVQSGGETYWPFYNKKLHPQKGLTVLWPPFWTHAHKGLPSHSTEKMIATGWFSIHPKVVFDEGGDLEALRVHKIRSKDD